MNNPNAVGARHPRPKSIRKTQNPSDDQRPMVDHRPLKKRNLVRSGSNRRSKVQQIFSLGFLGADGAPLRFLES